jgi:hypothetical protein
MWTDELCLEVQREKIRSAEGGIQTVEREKEKTRVEIVQEMDQTRAELEDSNPTTDGVIADQRDRIEATAELNSKLAEIVDKLILARGAQNQKYWHNQLGKGQGWSSGCSTEAASN